MSSKANFINGLPELLILRLLSRDEMYGYQLVQEITSRSLQAFNFGEGCIYPILHRMVSKGYLNERRDIVSGRPRVYYRISPKGKKHADALLRDWEGVVTAANAVMGARYA